jgi:hypothetical protein
VRAAHSISFHNSLYSLNYNNHSQSLNVLSHEELASNWPSGLNAAPVTAPEWPHKVLVIVTTQDESDATLTLLPS